MSAPYPIHRLDRHPELIERAAARFHAKWGIPEQAYLDSMRAMLAAAGIGTLSFDGPHVALRALWLEIPVHGAGRGRGEALAHVRQTTDLLQPV